MAVQIALILATVALLSVLCRSVSRMLTWECVEFPSATPDREVSYEFLKGCKTQSFTSTVYAMAGDTINANMKDFGVNLRWEVDRAFQAKSVVRAETNNGVRWFITDGERVVEMAVVPRTTSGGAAPK